MDYLTQSKRKQYLQEIQIYLEEIARIHNDLDFTYLDDNNLLKYYDLVRKVFKITDDLSSPKVRPNVSRVNRVNLIKRMFTIFGWPLPDFENTLDGELEIYALKALSEQKKRRLQKIIYTNK